MNTKKTIKALSLLMLAGIITILTSCGKDEVFATINVLAPQNKSGDVKGNGGSATRTWSFENPNTTAGWDMSIDAKGGSFRLVLEDASGTVVLDQTLTTGSGPQSADGTTPAGTAGTWTCTITLTSFNGSGDYSFL